MIARHQSLPQTIKRGSGFSSSLILPVCVAIFSSFFVKVQLLEMDCIHGKRIKTQLSRWAFYCLNTSWKIQHESGLMNDNSSSFQNIMVWLTSENGTKSSKTAARTEMNLNAISSIIQILVSLNSTLTNRIPDWIHNFSNMNVTLIY